MLVGLPAVFLAALPGHRRRSGILDIIVSLANVRAESVALLTVLVRGFGMFIRFVASPVIEMMGGHPVMVSGRFMMSRRAVVMIARCVFRHVEVLGSTSVRVSPIHLQSE